jgi:NAD(P)-dependent dehydrogenase (short-subunit alcohol dehydrogenase family)
VGISGVEVAEMDLLNPVSIDAFAASFLATERPVHILVNSAGIMACPLTRDARGYESQFATNHLGHFQLVDRLWPALRKANGARVVSVSSRAHHHTPIMFEDPNFERTEYEPILAYGQSKTANVLFAVALDRRGKAEGVQAFSLHPGAIVDTGLGKHMSREGLRKTGYVDEGDKAIIDPSRDMKTIEQGAATSVWCATSPRLDGFGGTYCQDCDIAPLAQQHSKRSDSANGKPGTLVRTGVMPYAIDPNAAEELWALSERLLAQ